MTPDMIEAARFLNLLAPGEDVTFQTFSDAKQKPNPDPLARILHGDPATLFEELARRNRLGAGVFWMPNRGDLKGRQMGNIVGIRALYVDLDGAPLAPVLEAGVHPSVIVETSPDRFHAYWRVPNCPMEEFRARQLQLAERFNGDPAIAQINSVMRVPGFVHQKDEARRFVSRIIHPKA